MALHSSSEVECPSSVITFVNAFVVKLVGFQVISDVIKHYPIPSILRERGWQECQLSSSRPGNVPF